MHPFPSFSSFKKIYKNIFSVSIITISISGILNIWFFCSLLLQRFSVPELKSNKLTVHLMFILGILANLIYIFFGFSPEILQFEHQKIKILQVSISMIIFLSFVFFNLLFAALTLNVLQNFKMQIASNDRRLNKNIKGKRFVAYITLFLLVLYISAILIRYQVNLNEYNVTKNNSKLKKSHSKLGHHNHGNKKTSERPKIADEDLLIKEPKNIYMKLLLDIVDIILFLFPYILFFFNSLLNLSYYFDILYFEDIINMVIDREYFLTNDESTNFFTEFPI